MLSDRIRKIGIREVARRLNRPLSSVSQVANNPKSLKAKDLAALGAAVGLVFSVKARTSVAKEKSRRTKGKMWGVWGNKKPKSSVIKGQMKLSAK